MKLKAGDEDDEERDDRDPLVEDEGEVDEEGIGWSLGSESNAEWSDRPSNSGQRFDL